MAENAVSLDPIGEWAGFGDRSYCLDGPRIAGVALKTQLGLNVPAEDVPFFKAWEAISAMETAPERPRGAWLQWHGRMIELRRDFRSSLLYELDKIRRAGVDPFGVNWLWYEKDNGPRDPEYAYSFFLADNAGKTVYEHATLFEERLNGIDPSIFKPDEDEPMWSSWPSKRAAFARLCYRRFYSETDTGHLALLRDDTWRLVSHRDVQGRELTPAQFMRPRAEADAASAICAVRTALRRIEEKLVIFGVLVVALVAYAIFR